MIFETIQTFLLIVPSWALFSATVSNDLFSCGFQGGPKQDTFKFADKCVIFSGKKGFNSGLFLLKFFIIVVVLNLVGRDVKIN